MYLIIIILKNPLFSLKYNKINKLTYFSTNITTNISKSLLRFSSNDKSVIAFSYPVFFIHIASRATHEFKII
ncbi:MAG: hypothetical protein LBB21_05925 [Holosporaceae bacterium]|nr:hypothetical protein [Holosporaceae bacterium]